MESKISNETINRLHKMIEDFSLEELHALNRVLVHRIKLFHKAGKFVALSRFAVGEKVSFPTRQGYEIDGTIIRINQKTATICESNGAQWTVSPELLKKGE